MPLPLPPPTANYPQSARDVDAFVWSHPDLLVLFNTGNYGGPGLAPASSLSAPGSAKNTLQVGGTRTTSTFNLSDDLLSNLTLVGPTRDGRIKPDVVGPAHVYGGDARVVVNSDCAATFQTGTSWASPTIAGAAALVRQYYTDGFYPSGVPAPSDRFTPSAALIKATIIASARRVETRAMNTGPDVATEPVPSYEQGFGFPVLDDALYFPGDRKRMRVVDVPLEQGLSAGASSTVRLNVAAGSPLRVVLVWTDPPGVVRPANDPTPQLVNDLDLVVTTPSGVRYGNDTLRPGQPDRVNNVEGVSLAQAEAGSYAITISANRLGAGLRQSYALVVAGEFHEGSARRRAAR